MVENPRLVTMVAGGGGGGGGGASVGGAGGAQSRHPASEFVAWLEGYLHNCNIDSVRWEVIRSRASRISS